MNAQQLHHQSVPREFLYPADPENFVPTHLIGKALNDDSCWDEYESEYEEPLPSSVFSCIDDDM